MKKLLASAIMASAVATSASAGSYTQMATVVASDPYFKSVTVSNPVQSCNTVEVPIYQQQKGGDDIGSFLGGAIIGGIIGNAVDGKGAAGVGAVLGGALANEHQKKHNTQQTIVGYRQEQRCSTQYVKEQHNVLQYYVVRAEYNGMPMEYRSNTPVAVGSRVQVRVTISK